MTNYVVGIDIGGTNLVVGSVTEDGSRLVALRSEPTRPEEGPDAVLNRSPPLRARRLRRPASSIPMPACWAWGWVRQVPSTPAPA
jgi:predicted NBD/HSP70 family sugar kinase